MCILLCTQNSLEPLSNIERFAVRSLFFSFFFNHGEMNSIKVSREQIETFFYYSQSYYYRDHQLWFRSSCLDAQHNICQNEGFLFLSAGKRKRKRRKLECSLKRRADLEKGKFFGLFYITVISDLLQCALTSLNERYMSFASCFLRLGHRKIKLR